MAETRQEHSAGGIVFEDGNVLSIKMRNLKGEEVWTFPKGHLDPGETAEQAAVREVLEETGIDIAGEDLPLRNWQQSHVFEIFLEWRHRYAPGVTHNTEHVYSLELPAPRPVTLAPGEHLDYCWLPWQEAADKVFSWTNRDAILQLAQP